MLIAIAIAEGIQGLGGHFVIVRLITLGHYKSILNWCRCNLVVSWVWNGI